MRIWMIVLSCCILDAAFVRAQPVTQAASFDPAGVAARVGDSGITLGMLHAIVQQRGMYRSNPAADAQRRRDLLDAEIDNLLFEFEAKSVSLKNARGALARIRRGLTISGVNQYLQDILSERLILDSATIDTFYHNHISRYTAANAQRRARVITVWKEGKAPAQGMITYVDSLYQGWYPEDKIDSLYVRLSEGEDFRALATVHSEDANTRPRGGELGWVSEYSLAPGVFTERVMKQPLFMYSKPFETDNAWHIVQALADRPAGPVPMDDEIRADIVEHLMEQQRSALLKHLGDSLVSAATIEWHDDYTTMPHDQLQNEMVLVVVNGRDTVYAEEFLQEQFKWKDPTTRQLPDPARRFEILQADYVRFVCWYGLLRDKGYLERADLRDEAERRLQSERIDIVRTRVAAGPFPEPDSAAIQKYYRDSIHLYGDAPNALGLAWNSIKTKLVSDARDRAYLKWRTEASARHGVTRYLDRLATLPLLEPRRSR